MVRIAVRGIVEGRVLFEHIYDDDGVTGEQNATREAIVLSALLRLQDYPLHTVELEFLDETDPTQRFARIGTDPAGMVMPVDLADALDALAKSKRVD